MSDSKAAEEETATSDQKVASGPSAEVPATDSKKRKDSNTESRDSDTTTTEIEASIKAQNPEEQNHKSVTISSPSHLEESPTQINSHTSIVPDHQQQQYQTAPVHRSPTPGTPCSDGRKMNGLSLSELCCLFCCPPCPGQIACEYPNCLLGVAY